MRRQGEKVKRQAIAGEDGQTAGRQALCDFVHQLVSHGLRAWTEGESRDELSAGLAGDPQPGRFSGPAQSQAQFVELHRGEVHSSH